MILAAPRVLTPDPLGPGWVRVEDGLVVEVAGGAPPAGATDLGDVTLCPGFVDMHAHGGGGASFADGPGAARRVLAVHRAHGTTSMVASLVTDTVNTLAAQVAGLAPLATSGELLGTHLEGPWLSPAHHGAHDPALLRAPDAADVETLLRAGRGTVAMVTLAPELTGAPEAVARLAAAGVVVALGHSDATYDQACAALDAGARVATHLFNAMRAPHHREPGIAGAVLDRAPVTVELIADGLHLHDATLRHVSRAAAGRFALVTDAMAAAGLGDGDYALGPLAVRVRGGGARLADGTIAGSTLTLDRAVARAVRAGLGLPEAVAAATRTPADALGRRDLGRLAPGARADLVTLGEDLGVRAVWRAGRPILGA